LFDLERRREEGRKGGREEGTEADRPQRKRRQ